jgi:hypothetical protein
MGMIQGPERKNFWSMDPISEFVGAPFWINYMSSGHFHKIVHCLRYTNDAPPTYCNRFFEIRKLVQAWNENMAINFSPGWISCLDESMSIWPNKYSCPGYMFVPRKPWPFGNKNHTIVCGVFKILYNLEQLRPIHWAHCRAEKNFLAPKWWIQRSITHKQGAIPAKRKSECIVLYVLFWCCLMWWLFRSACFWCWNWKWQSGTDSSLSKFFPNGDLWAAFFSVIYLVIHLKCHVIHICYSAMSQLPIEKLLVGQCCCWVIGGQR